MPQYFPRKILTNIFIAMSKDSIPIMLLAMDGNGWQWMVMDAMVEGYDLRLKYLRFQAATNSVQS